MNITTDNKVAVIARFKEQNTFLGECLEKAGYKVITFNKHEGDNLLPNVGREGHTYLHYIVENYDNLPDEVLFSQCDIGDHYNDRLIQRARNQHPNPETLNMRNSRSQHRLVFHSFLDAKLLDFVGWACNDYDSKVCRIRDGLIDYLGYTQKCLGQEISEREVADQLLSYPMGYYGVMRASKAGILSRDKQFYERCLALMDKEVNPKAGFYFEKIWPWIFTLNGAIDSPKHEHYRGRWLIIKHQDRDKMSGRRRRYQNGSVGHIQLLPTGKVYFSSTHAVAFDGFHSDHDLKYWTIRDDTLYLLDDFCAIFQQFDIEDSNLEDADLAAEGDDAWVLSSPLWMSLARD